MPSIYTNFDGDDFDAFNDFLKAEGLKSSPGLLRIFREWRSLTAGAAAISRYATISPERLNLILGEAAEIKRALKRCELALLAPRPMKPDELPAWKAQQDGVQATLARIDQWQDELIRTGTIIATPPVDLEAAQELALHSYNFGDSPKAAAFRKVIFGLLRLFIVIPARPIRPQPQPAKAPPTSTQLPPKS